MKRYNNIDYVMNMDIEDGLNLIIKAFKNDTKDKLYKLYLVQYPYMDKKNYISFDDFFKKCTTTRVVTNKSKEEIYKNVENILKNNKFKPIAS